MIDLELAARMSQAAVSHASGIGALVSVAVVDQGGHLVHFQRMDGAEVAGPTLAVDKAFTAVAHRIETAALAELTQPGGELWGLQANGGGRYVVFGGGLPCWRDGLVIGAIGVSGGSAAEDAACASAGHAVYESFLSGQNAE